MLYDSHWVEYKNNLYPIIEMIYYARSDVEKSGHWETVFNKLVQASKDVELGLSHKGLDSNNKSYLDVYKWLLKAKDELAYLPSMAVDVILPSEEELSVLQAFPRLSLYQDSEDLLKLLRDVAKADVGRKFGE